MCNINDLLRQRVTLDIECMDRICLNGYVPSLQVPGQLVNLLIHQRGHPIPSPALLRQMGDAFVRSVQSFAEEGHIPIVDFERGERKDDVAAEQRRSLSAAGGVVFIGIAQEKASAFKASKVSEGKLVGFSYSRQSVFANHYYFYLQDEDFGPAFIKVCTYDLRRLRLKGIVWRVPGHNRYLVTPYGYRVALLFTRLNARDFRTTFASFDAAEPIPRPLADALAKVDRQIDHIIAQAKLDKAA